MMTKRARRPQPRAVLGPGLRCAILARQSVSDGSGADSLSIGSMVRELTERCAREGWPVVAVIEAPNVKGWADEADRPDIREALALAESGKIDLLLIWKGDRFARTVALQEQWVARLLDLGVEVESHTEPAWRTTRLVRVVLGAMAEQTTDDISANIRRALHDRVRRGLLNGKMPWGYKRPLDAHGLPDKNKPLVIDETIAPHLRLIFDLRRQGWGTRRIADELERRGIPTPSGLRVWRDQTVRALLAHPAYRGALRFGALIVEDCHPAIIPPADWQAVQWAARPRQMAAKGEPASWLAGHVIHACGAPMYVMAYGDRRVAPALTCRDAAGGRHHRGEPPCGVRPATVRAAAAEARAWEAVIDALGRVLSVDEAIADAETAYRAAEPGAATLRRALDERQARLLASRRRIEELFRDGARDRAWFDAEDAMLAAQLAAVEADLAALPAAPDHDAIAADVAALRGLSAIVGSMVVPSDRAAVLAELGQIVIEPLGAIPAGRQPRGWFRARLQPWPRFAFLLDPVPA